MAPIRSAVLTRRRSSLSLLSTRRRSLIAPKNYTFAPNVTPITYPSDPASPSSTSSLNANVGSTDGADANGERDEAVPFTPVSAPSRPRRRGGRKDSAEHIPRPPNAFMLFRQNFVHQRHVPGSIETNHNSLSKIVGNCWKALPAADKKVWEELAEKKKEEHKKLYPGYRFQPKHDPEKKRKRQAARLAAGKAERERIEREELGVVEENEDECQLTLDTQEKERAMTVRRQQVRAAHNHLGHRRSSSVPLPNETYNYPYNSYPHADPFNFANPALANAPPSSASVNGSNGIAIPTLPSNLSGLVGSWYTPNQNANMNPANAGSPASNEEERESGSQLALPPHLQAHQQLQMPMTLSRAGSPRMPHTGFGPMATSAGFSGMGIGMNTMGMGTRAARQHQLGQLGRRASSTQPSLQHQLASGAFSGYHLDGGVSSFAHQHFTQHSGAPFDFNQQRQTQQHVSQNQSHFNGFDGFVGAVAEGFINPFASSSAPAESAQSVTPTSAPGTYPAPLAPHAIWYEVESVDPMTPITGAPSPSTLPGHGSFPHSRQQVQSAPSLPEVNTTFLNPAFNFGNSGATSSHDTEADGSSALGSASRGTARNEFVYSSTNGMGSTPGSNGDSAPGTGMRESFDFSAFLADLPQDQHHYQLQHGGQNPNADPDSGAYGVQGVPPHTVHSDAGAHLGLALAHPVPVRKVVPPICDPNNFYVAEHEHSQHGYSYQPSQLSATSESTGSSVNSSPASARAEMSATSVAQQHQMQQHGSEDMVSGHELLDGPVDVHDPAAERSRLQTQTGLGVCVNTDMPNFGYTMEHPLDLGMNVGMHELGAHGMDSGLGLGLSDQLSAQQHMGLNMDMGYGGYSQGSAQDANADPQAYAGPHDTEDMGPRFSFSDYVHGSPFLSAAVVN
ncbi:hypothetical protein M0805_009593 [Coniferiporia weirii]|nr:hypothetical protein M0805_009593 [Coniferiporia weirii]